MNEKVSPPGIYAASSLDEPLRQGEILSDVVQFQLKTSALDEIPVKGDAPPFDRVEHPLVVVISQDCDLDQDFKYREQGKKGKEVTGVLLCELHLAEHVYNLDEINSPIW